MVKYDELFWSLIKINVDLPAMEQSIILVE